MDSFYWYAVMSLDKYRNGTWHSINQPLGTMSVTLVACVDLDACIGADGNARYDEDECAETLRTFVELQVNLNLIGLGLFKLENLRIR